MRYSQFFIRLAQRVRQLLHQKGHRFNIFFTKQKSVLTSFNPLFFWLFLLVIPLILLFLLKNRPVKKNVSTIIFWQRVQKKQRCTWLKRPRRFLSLLTALTFLTLLIFALVDPSCHPSAKGRNISRKITSNNQPFNDSIASDSITLNEIAAKDVVIVFDNSASMNAVEKEGLTRFELAQKTLDLFLTRKENGATALLTTANDSQIVFGWTPASGALALRRKARQILPTDSSGQLNKTLDLALELIADRPQALVLVLTDGSGQIPRQDLLRSDKIRFLLFGSDRCNTAITLFQPRRSPEDPVNYQILLEISRFGKTPFSGHIEISLNGTPVEIVPISLKANQSRKLIIPLLTELKGILTARIVSKNSSGNTENLTESSIMNHSDKWKDDALESDNSARAYLPDCPPLTIFLLHKPGFFLGHILQALPFTKIELLKSVPRELPINSVLVLEKEIPAPCPSGNIFLINPQSENDLFKTEPLQEPPIAILQKGENNWNRSSELFSDLSFDRKRSIHEVTDSNKMSRKSFPPSVLRFAPLENSPFLGAKKLILKTEENCYIPLKTSKGNSLLLLYESLRGKTLVLNADPDRGEMALTTAFPIFFSNVFNWFREDGSQRNNDLEISKSFAPSYFYFGDERKNESNLAVNSPVFSTLNNRIKQTTISYRPIRFWLTLTALGLIFFEWFLYQRRWTD